MSDNEGVDFDNEGGDYDNLDSYENSLHDDDNECKLEQHNHIDTLSYFLNPFITNINNFEDVVYTQEELIYELQNLYSSPTFCIGCHINAFKLSIIDNLEADENYNEICSDIIIPTIIKILNSNQIDTDEIQTSTIEQWYLEQEKKPKPASEDIINQFKVKKIETTNGHGCFCGDENNKEVIKLECCNNFVHLDCILKWFETNNTCPYCREKYI